MAANPYSKSGVNKGFIGIILGYRGPVCIDSLETRDTKYASGSLKVVSNVILAIHMFIATIGLALI
jgi:hypothetical protein